MSKRRVSLENAQLSGAAAVNPARFEGRKKMPPTRGAIGAPPKRLEPAVAEIWAEIVAAIPEGVSGFADRHSVEMASALMFEFRTAYTEMSASRMSLLSGILGRLGLDPQGRTKLQVQDEKPDTNDEYSFLN